MSVKFIIYDYETSGFSVFSCVGCLPVDNARGGADFQTLLQPTSTRIVIADHQSVCRSKWTMTMSHYKVKDQDQIRTLAVSANL